MNHLLIAPDDRKLRQMLQAALLDNAETADLPGPAAAMVAATALPLCRRIMEHAASAHGMTIAGICAAQGSGKTTVTGALTTTLSQTGLAVVSLSMDDLYLPRAARIRLARDIHPLFRTRGVPGTHDIARAMMLLDGLERADPGQPIALPAFDKAQDDRVPAVEEPIFHGRPNVVLIEGWCMGAVAIPEAALAEPVNSLEQEEDSDGIWRHHMNQQLAGSYQSLFDRLDLLMLLKAPNFEQVYEWRREQETKLISRLRAEGRDIGSSAVMEDAALARFIMHYERLTRHILDEMPARADVVVALDAGRCPIDILTDRSVFGQTPARPRGSSSGETHCSDRMQGPPHRHP